MFRVEVKFLDPKWNSKSEGIFLDRRADAEVRKRGERKGFGTPLVHAVNDVRSLLESMVQATVVKLTR